jgi:hypothetical protein
MLRWCAGQRDQVFAIDGKATKTVQAKMDDLLMVLNRSDLRVEKGLEFILRNGRSHFLFLAIQKSVLQCFRSKRATAASIEWSGDAM